MGRQLCGSDWFRGRVVRGRAQRGESWGGSDMGLLWTSPLSVRHRYNTVRPNIRSQETLERHSPTLHVNSTCLLYTIHVIYVAVNIMPQHMGTFTHLVRVRMEDSVSRWCSWPITESLSGCKAFWVMLLRCAVEGSTLWRLQVR